MASTIKLKNGSGAPLAGDLVQGEPALDLTNKRLYTENASGTVIEVGTNPGEDVTFADNRKAVFGAGSDLQIYHDGSNSYISDQGTGNLRILAEDFRLVNSANSETMIQANTDGDVRLYYDSILKLSTTSTGIDVTGTVTADGLTVDGTTNFNSNSVIHTSTTPNYVLSESDVVDENTQFLQASGSLRIRTVDDAGSNVAERLRIDHGTGDISFYEDTGTTAKMVWDASEEKLTTSGLTVSGTTNTPTVFESSAAASYVQFKDSGTTTDNNNRIGSIGDTLTLWSGGSKAVTIDASQNVGIGTTSPSNVLHINNSNPTIRLEDSDGSGAGIAQVQNTASGNLRLIADPNNDGAASSTIEFEVDGSEAMRISSGNLLVGKTSDDNTTVGMVVSGNGYTKIVRQSATANVNTVLNLNRLTTDGEIARFQKDGTTVGSIGTSGGDIYLSNGTKSLLLAGSLILPRDGTGGISDGTVDLGNSSNRFKDLYRSGSTISTSDARMKQDIRNISEAERSVAIACKPLLKAFRYTQEVDLKGGDAPIRFGVIAQELESAFLAEGLIADDYAMFRRDITTDDNGVETERLGVCYENLLAFIIAAI